MSSLKNRPWTLLFLCCLFSGLVSLAVERTLPRVVQFQTDIIGFPVHSYFDINRYFDRYYLAFFLFPLLTLCLFHWFSRKKRSRPEAVPLPVTPRLLDDIGFWFRTAVLGTLLGYAAVAFLGKRVPDLRYWGLGFLVTEGLLAAAMQKRGGRALLAEANALLWPFVLLALPGLVQNTWIESEGGRTSYAWLPLPLWGTAFMGVLGWVGVAFARAKDLKARARLESNLFFVIGAPLFIYLSTAYLNGGVPPLLFFHHGETAASGLWLERGYFPWRDLLFIHGLLDDPFKSILGFRVFEPTWWGVEAGVSMVLHPVYFVVQYYFLLFLLGERRSWAPLISLGLPIVAPHLFGHTHYRMIFLPLMFSLFYGVLQRATLVRCALFTLVTFGMLIVVPETAYVAPALVFTLILFEWTRTPKVTTRLRFRRTLLCASVSVCVLAGWAYFLWRQEALSAFVEYYRIFGKGHRFTGGVPVESDGRNFRLFMLVPFVVYVGGIGILYRTVRARTDGLRHWILFALGLFGALYYVKFLSRADMHVLHPYCAVLAGFFVLVVWGLERLDRRVATLGAFQRFSWGSWGPLSVTIACVLGVWTLIASQCFARVHPFRFQYTKQVRESECPRQGWSLFSEKDRALVHDMRRILAAFPGAKNFFDFSNQPGLFHFLLEKPPAVRFFHVSMTNQPQAQLGLIEELEGRQIDLVAYTTYRSNDISSWDHVPNAVRHSLVSQYLLQHFNPWVEAGGFLFLTRKGRSAPPPESLGLKTRVYTTGLHARVEACTWGFAPFVFRKSPSDAGQSLPFTVKPYKDGALLEIVFPPDTMAQPQSLEIQASRLGAGQAFLADHLGPYDRTNPNYIQFSVRALQEPTSLTLPIGSCLQWYGFAGPRLYLLLDHPGTVVTAVKLKDLRSLPVRASRAER